MAIPGRTASALEPPNASLTVTLIMGRNLFPPATMILEAASWNSDGNGISITTPSSS